jgi:polar amino acid transport system substrate-binding protein
MKNHPCKSLLLASLVASMTLFAAACGSGGSGGSDGKSDYGLVQPGTLLAATSGDQPPFSSLKNGKPVGFTIDLNDEVARRLKLKTEYKQTTTDSGIQGLTVGQYDVVANGLGVTPERQGVVTFAKGEYWSTTAALVLRSTDISSFGDLKGKKVAVITGSVQADYLKKLSGAVETDFPSENAAVSALTSKTVDAFLVGGPDAENYMKQLPALKVGASQPVDHPTTVAFAKDGTALAKAYDKELSAMVADGTYRKIYDRYFSDPPNKELVAIWPGLA